MQHMPPMQQQQQQPVQQQQQPQSDWTEHPGPNGRSYFFNRVTKVSTWTKPDELMTAVVSCLFSHNGSCSVCQCVMHDLEFNGSRCGCGIWRI